MKNVLKETGLLDECLFKKEIYVKGMLQILALLQKEGGISLIAQEGEEDDKNQ